VPPHSAEAEQSVLGGLLLDNLAWDRAADLLTDSDFYRYEHRHIYAAIGAWSAPASRPTSSPCFEVLQSLGKADECGGLAYLNALAQSVPSAANVRRYAEIVRERAILRKLIAPATRSPPTPSTRRARRCRRSSTRPSRRSSASAKRARAAAGFQQMDKLVGALLDRVDELDENGAEDVTGVRTGFYDLDRMTAGLQKGDLIVLAARPSMGKTAFALNIAEHVAVRKACRCWCSRWKWAPRSWRCVWWVRSAASTSSTCAPAACATTNGSACRGGHQAEQAQIFIDETPGLNPAELRARARRLARQYGGTLGLIVIDYLQLMSGSGGSDENRATVLGEISRGMKGLAKELQCPVIALSQLNRSVESRPTSGR
jgi:replicative DNA helicase